MEEPLDTTDRKRGRACTAESTFRHAGVRYHVRRWGDPADVPLLALHGFMQTGATWGPVAADLADGRCVYAIDFVGHGQSDKPHDPAPYAIDAMVDALAAFIVGVMLREHVDAVAERVDAGVSYADAVVADRRAQDGVHAQNNTLHAHVQDGAPRRDFASTQSRVRAQDDAYARGRIPAQGNVHVQNRVDVLGYSMGGRIALELVAQYPELVRTLVLESAGLGPADEAEREAYAKRAEKWARDLREQGIRPFVDRWEQLPLFASQQRLPEDVRARVRAERLANDAEALALTLENSGQDHMHLQGDYLEWLSRSRIPVCYLSGALDEKYQKLAERLAHGGFETKTLRGGHNLHLEVPDRYREALDGFYRAIET
jgi:2-succinyl-6-hydroxy-2,4-cyclohexadiene-1-carboxylate synthase